MDDDQGRLDQTDPVALVVLVAGEVDGNLVDVAGVVEGTAVVEAVAFVGGAEVVEAAAFVGGVDRTEGD